jgi:hypothetical protein
MKAPPVQEAVVESLGIERQLTFFTVPFTEHPVPYSEQGATGQSTPEDRVHSGKSKLSVILELVPSRIGSRSRRTKN